MKSIFSVPSLLAAVSLGLITAACSSSDDSTGAPPNPAPGATSTTPAPTPTTAPTPTASRDIVDTAIANGSFKTLVGAVQGAGLEATLRGPGPFTVFAPNDAAFQKLPSFLLAKLVTEPYKAELGLILKYHVLSGSVKAADVLGKTSSPATVGGARLAIDGNGGKVVINGMTNVSTPDVAASNGIIHVIDGVLLPSIVDTAVGYDDGTTKFSTLVTAVTAADLGSTLSGPGTFTVFAPTDKAFADLKMALGDTAFNAILADKPKLQKILKYHVLASTVYAKDVAPGKVATVEGGSITIAASGSDVTIADATPAKAKILLTDLPNRNGVIHVIDKVLLPPGP